MKKIISLIILVLLIASCAPTAEQVQKAIAQTQTAMPTSTPTITPTSLPTPTKTPAETSTPTPNYYLETGFCVMMVGKVTGDLTDVPGCGPKEREQVYLGVNQALTVTFNNHISDRQNYCALFKLDGTFVMSDMDTTGSGKVTCYVK
jgi:hypothetical protein